MQIRRQTLIAFLVVSLGIASAWLSTSPLLARQTTLDSKVYSGLRWRLLGPFRGGRVDAVSGVPGRPNEFYFGSVNGGVWKTIDAGRVWKPVFDGQPVASIGALAVASSQPGHDLRRQRRIDAARFDGLRQRRLQVDRRRPDLDASRRSRRDAAHRQGRRRSEESRHRLRRRDRASLRRASRARRVSIAERRPHAGRRCCSRTTASAPSTS